MADIYGTRCPHCGVHNNFDVDEKAIAARCGRCDRKLFEGRSFAVSGEEFLLYAADRNLPVLLLCIARDLPKTWFDTDFYAKLYEPHLRVLTIDALDHHKMMTRYGVQAVPAGLLLRSGRVVARADGQPVPRGHDPFLHMLQGQGVPRTRDPLRPLDD